MIVDKRLSELKEQIRVLEEKFCENCQEWDCDNCHAELIDEVDEDENS